MSRDHSPAARPLTRRGMMLGTAQATAAVTAAGALAGVSAQAEEGDGEIWDAHVHLSGVTGTVEERVDRLLEFADRLGIARLVVFMGTSFVRHPSPEEVRQQNDEVLRAIGHAPDRVLGMAYLNPEHAQESLAEMDRCIRDGSMVGVKLWVAMRCSRPELDPIVRRSVELQVPVLQHTFDHVDGGLPGESTSADMAALAVRHPDAALICAHTGGDWERGVRTIRACPNVCAEVCGSDPTAGFVEMAVRELGSERVIYASDAGGRSFASQLAKVTGADVSATARRLVLGGNLRRLLAPALAMKGAKP